MQKIKFIFLSLVTAAMLLTGCSAFGAPIPETEAFQGIDAETASLSATEAITAIDSEQAEIQEAVLLTQPPVLCLTDPLSSQINSFEIQSGNYSWSYPDGDEMCSPIACGPHPLDDVPGVRDKILKVSLYHDQDTTAYTYSCQIPPDRLLIRKWNSSDIGNTDAPELSVTTFENAPSSIELEPGFVYEFTLEWKEEHLEKNGFYGMASYAFITE